MAPTAHRCLAAKINVGYNLYWGKGKHQEDKIKWLLELWIDGYGQTEANREFQGMILDTVFVNFAGISPHQLKSFFMKI